jgi:hypothetical protein
VEQKNWAVVRTVVGYHRYDTPAELALLNQIWVLQSQLTNYFLPQQKLLAKVRDGAKVTKTYNQPTTPQRRAEQHAAVSDEDEESANSPEPEWSQRLGTIRGPNVKPAAERVPRQRHHIREVKRQQRA